METLQSPAIHSNKKIYAYQQSDIQLLLSKLESAPSGSRLLYQLPTGGGKTVIFSEIAKNYIQKYSRQVVVLTHRIELCRQTSSVLKRMGINNQAYTSEIKKKPQSTA